jgi:hypothetical protein
MRQDKQKIGPITRMCSQLASALWRNSKSNTTVAPTPLYSGSRQLSWSRLLISSTMNLLLPTHYPPVLSLKVGCWR